MGLNDALSNAMSGLRANQRAMAVISSNVANKETPGYVTKTINQVSSSNGQGVQTNGVNRQLDEYIQAQLRTETSGATYASVRSNFLQQLQGMYGDPGAAGSLENSFNQLTTALQALSTSPDSQSARLGVINAANVMAQQLNAMSNGVQSLRGAAETGIKDSVDTANNLMKQIAAINNKVQSNPTGTTATDETTAALLDQRDQLITQLSGLMDIRVYTNSLNQVSISTSAGVQLVGAQAAQLSFNAQGTVNPASTWNEDPSLSTLGSITVSYGDGVSIDITNGLKSGTMAAYVELRDKTLVEAQTQLDQFAAALASAVSDTTTAGTPATSGAQSGFAVDTAGMKAGNSIELTYKDSSGVSHQLTIVRVDDASVLPLPASSTVNPKDQVLGIDFSGGMASVVAQLNAALGGQGVNFSNTGTSLTVLNNVAGTSSVAAATITKTQDAAVTADGSVQIALFTDNGKSYSGATTIYGSQMTGLAGRIGVNNAIKTDPSTLVKFATNTSAGDTTRSAYILSQLSTTKFAYSPSTGVGSTATPYTGTLLSYMQQFVSQQGAAADAAEQLAVGQDVVLNTLQQKMSTTSGVNMDEELAHLLQLQNAYSANARVMSTVNEMYKTLMQAM